MRSVRMRLLVSHLILVLLLGLVMSSAISNFVALGRGVDRVLEGNYKSISAAQQMQNGLMIDTVGVSELLVDRRPDARDRFIIGDKEFKDGLNKALDAINETGEAEIIKRIDDLHQQHRNNILSLLNQSSLTKNERAHLTHGEAVNHGELRLEIDNLIQLNQNAMLRESSAVKSMVQNAAGRSMLVAGIALILAITLTIALSRDILKPLRMLADRAKSIGEGDLDQRLFLNRTDELGSLAKSFNHMADRLQEAKQRAIQRLQRAEQMSDQALESLYDPVIVTDAVGNIAYLNKAAEGLFGPSPANPRTPVIAHKGDELIVKAINRAIQQETVLATEDDTSLIPIQVGETTRKYRQRVTPMKDDHGELLGTVVVLEDITHLKEVDRLKTEFIGVASHELRTPVTSLIMSVQLLEEGAVGELNDSQKQVVAVQREDLERLQRLMQELLDLSKLEAGTQPLRYSLIDAEALIQGAISSTRAIASEKQISVKAELDPDLQPLRADRSQIERVLINLISNAIRHSAPGKGIRVRATRDGDQVTFTIEDQGEGIPKEYLAEIFDRFVQVPGATGGGAGLGLSIAHNILKAHGGSIWADSELGAGSAFHFTLPTDPVAVGEQIS